VNFDIHIVDHYDKDPTVLRETHGKICIKCMGFMNLVNGLFGGYYYKCEVCKYESM
jgi:hypothetical protein